MNGQLLQFAGSLAAIAAVIALTHFLGFSRTGRVAEKAEARALFALAPGGFEPAALLLDQEGHGAIARDGAGRLAVLVPHGGQFVARLLEAEARITAADGRLLIESRQLGGKQIALSLDESARDWAKEIRTEQL